MKKKLIEVALPLDAINAEAAREKSIRHGHPSTLHLWWARRPLAACRAVLFASLVDDPSSHPEKFPTKEEQEQERQRLFQLIEELVKWKNIHEKDLYLKAWEEILASTNNNPPPVLDPFAGGGSIPLEAQRLGLEAHASDLNPVAVLINKALIEIPPRFANRPPVNPEAQAKIGGSSEWKGATGLAEDVRYYGEWMRKKAFEKIGHLYPPITVPATATMQSCEATVIAWLWARTVKCSNPACGAEMPLVNSYCLSTKEGKEAWVEPVVNKKTKQIEFTVKSGKGKAPDSPKVGRGASFRCECCGQVTGDNHIKRESMAGRMSAKLLAIVAEGKGGRVYLSPNKEHEEIAKSAKPAWKPEQEMNRNTTNLVSGRGYGFFTWGDLFTSRQLTALTTFSDLVGEAIAEVKNDMKMSTDYTDSRGLDEGGDGARAYAEAVGVYLAFIVDKVIDYNSSICSWHNSGEKVRNTFARQAIPMVWDFAESNPFCNSSGSWNNMSIWIYKSLNTMPANINGYVFQHDATNITPESPVVISTDPPYYDNIGYADLSDFFYIWLRRSLNNVYPNLFSSTLVSKAKELVATPYRFNGNKEKAKVFFENGMLEAFRRMRNTVLQDYPLTVYYAYKQTEDEGDEDTTVAETTSSGWETMLQAIINAGFSITGTWPLRTEMKTRQVARNTNALASSIAIVCRPRPDDAPSRTRRAFLAELRDAIRNGLQTLQSGNIAPVDLAQASIGPGIAVYSKYREVLEADGSPLTVRQALAMINHELDAFLGEQSGSLDHESQFCVAWFEQYGFREGPYGEAHTLMRARMAGEHRLKEAGILEAKGGKVRLLRRGELETEGFEKSETMVWAIVQRLCRPLDVSGGLDQCAALMSTLPASIIEQVKTLAYRIYQICDRKGWSEDALAYNNLVATWGILEGKTKNAKKHEPKQGEFGL